jgi:succinoglycan biosynthesis transport protein ExoP
MGQMGRADVPRRVPGASRIRPRRRRPVRSRADACGQGWSAINARPVLKSRLAPVPAGPAAECGAAEHRQRELPDGVPLYSSLRFRESSLDLRAQLAVLRGRWSLVALVAILAVAASLAVSLATPKNYASQATLIVGQSLTSSNPDINQIAASQRLGTTYARIATMRPVLEAVIAKLHLQMSSDQLASHVGASVPQDSTLLTISAEMADPQSAAAIANELAAQLIATSPTVQGQQAGVAEFVADDLRNLQAQISNNEAQLTEMLAIERRTPEQETRLQAIESRLASLRSAYAGLLAFSSDSAVNRLTVVEPAIPAPGPVSPRLLVNLVLALVLGTLLGIGLAFLADYLDDTVKTVEDVERLTGVPVLGTVPRSSRDPDQTPIYGPTTLRFPRSASAEAFRTIRTNLEFSGLDAPTRTILVTSALPREGKTTVAGNLAVAFAQAGRRTMLIDADFRRPDVNRVFAIEEPEGLTTLLMSRTMTVDRVARRVEHPNLWVVTSGPVPPNPADLLASARMHEILESIAAAADIVIIDSPPISVVADAAVLARLVEGVVLVVDLGGPRSAARRQSAALSKVGARVLGAVVNRVPQAKPMGIYGYYDPGDDAGVAVIARAEGGGAVPGPRATRWPRRGAH